ncbi:MFS transporter [Actinomadura rupiterrae]|uniref:MFS transporter n=1 Tax=Actinomadura rupiterrae TaxID=559627 RepID=UPI0020A2A24F|nr:MFS transporter [Actinomadura rupiterrae]MCP2342868.1 MFS family permease [Actinomadura rupiterrae]
MTAPSLSPCRAPAAERLSAWGPVALAMFGVGWGANQFASLLGLYADRLHLGGGETRTMFAIYALGLVPGLALGGPASDRYGRRRLVLPFASASALVTAVLMAGASVPSLLYAGRLAAGVVTGAVLAAGTAWVKELAPRSGTRITALAVSAGFGAGPLVAALVAQWVPDPLLTAYVPHLLIMAVAVPLLFRTPEFQAAPPQPPESAPITSDTIASGASAADPGAGVAGRGSGREFWRAVAPVAIWSFTAPVNAFAVLPIEVPVHHLRIAYAGLVTAITLAAGMAAQPVARRLEARHPRLVARTGLTLAAAGLVVAALTTATGLPELNVVAAVLLGAAYGFVLTYSLAEAARIAAPGELARLTAIVYALVYLGMFTPLLLTALTALASLTVLLGAGAALAALSLVWIWIKV